MEKRNYDVIIIGGGIGGLFAAYELRRRSGDMKIAVIDRGAKMNDRHCPSSEGKPCVHCRTCAITSGIAGSGSFSDAKFNLGTAYGGTLGDELGEIAAMKYISTVDGILEYFSDDYPKLYESNEDLKLKCLQNGLVLLDMNVRHLGTDRNVVTMGHLIDWLSGHGIDIFEKTDCLKVRKEDGRYLLDVRSVYGFDAMSSDRLIVATGRGGAGFVKALCDDFGIAAESNSVDIGVRVEMKDIIWREFSSKIYEPKILYTTKTFEDRCRMFCFNQGGIVSAENNRGIITSNGHSFADPAKKTENCNFAILSSIHFTEPFDQPTEYVENISKLANMIGNGNVLIQKFGDLIRGRRTNEHRLGHCSVTPTLKATAGDISLVLPHRILTNIIETIYALDRVAPGTANDDTLLYGCESKYYSLKPRHDGNFQVSDGMYLIGDGSGISRGLSQAAAMGLFVADSIIGE